MQVDIDPKGVEVLINLWRDGVDMKAPMHDEIKIHMMENRYQILHNHARAAGAWCLLLATMTPVGDPSEFEALLAEVRAFRDWAAAEIKAIEAMRQA